MIIDSVDVFKNLLFLELELSNLLKVTNLRVEESTIKIITTSRVSGSVAITAKNNRNKIYLTANSNSNGEKILRFEILVPVAGRTLEWGCIMDRTGEYEKQLDRFRKICYYLDQTEEHYEEIHNIHKVIKSL